MDSSIAIPPLDATYGCLVLGLSFTMALWGTGTLQLYLYYDRYWRSDKWWLKFLVFVVWAMDTVHQAFIIQIAYTDLVTNFANASSIGKMNTTVVNTVLLTAFVSALVQALFVQRIWRLSKRNRKLTGSVTILVIGNSVPSIMYFAKARHFIYISQLFSIISLQRTFAVITAFTDVTITIVLVYFLKSSRTEFRSTSTLISRLVVYTINTGLFPALSAIASMLSGFFSPGSYIYLFFYLLISRLYTNSMLASLNSRQGLRSDFSGVSCRGMKILMTRSTFGTRSAPTSPDTYSVPSSSHVVDIKVDTVIENDSDGNKNSASMMQSDSDTESSPVHDIHV